jgi:hypothetical protein
METDIQDILIFKNGVWMLREVYDARRERGEKWPTPCQVLPVYSPAWYCWVDNQQPAKES